MRLKLPTFLLALFLNIHVAHASDTIETTLPDAAIVGRGVLSYAFWDVYEARLYAPQGRFEPEKPFSLSLTYYHEIDGKDIADISIQEMRKQGFDDEAKLALWRSQMEELFPDVKDGTILTAIYTPGTQTTFYKGADIIGTIKGDDFSRLFFGIWLNEKTSEPELRRSLLGLL